MGATVVAFWVCIECGLDTIPTTDINDVRGEAATHDAHFHSDLEDEGEDG